MDLIESIFQKREENSNWNPVTLFVDYAIQLKDKGKVIEDPMLSFEISPDSLMSTMRIVILDHAARPVKTIYYDDENRMLFGLVLGQMRQFNNWAFLSRTYSECINRFGLSNYGKVRLSKLDRIMAHDKFSLLADKMNDHLIKCRKSMNQDIDTYMKYYRVSSNFRVSFEVRDCQVIVLNDSFSNNKHSLRLKNRRLVSVIPFRRVSLTNSTSIGYYPMGTFSNMYSTFKCNLNPLDDLTSNSKYKLNNGIDYLTKLKRCK